MYQNNNAAEARMMRLEARVREMERSQLPRYVRLAVGGGGENLPTGTGLGKVLIIIDNETPGTWGVDYPMFHTAADPAEVPE